jgi:SAM-dependent methyltransferase
MLQVSEVALYFVILPNETKLPEKLHDHFPTPGKKLGAAVLYKSQGALDSNSDTIASQLRQHGYLRVFECFWLPCDVSANVKKVLVESLFSTIAGSYDSIVTPRLNLDCYDYLYFTAKNRMRRNPTRVLDFGCGTGLITQTQIASEVPILKGFDFSKGMVALAQEKGLDVLDASLEHISLAGPFDLVLASYVFHYGLNEDDWSALLKCVASDGLILGNFHKGIGLAEAFHILKRIRFDCAYEVIDSYFGPIIVFNFGSKDICLC